MEYDWEAFHIEIENEADTLGLDPLEALDVWKCGIESYECKKRESLSDEIDKKTCEKCGEKIQRMVEDYGAACEREMKLARLFIYVFYGVAVLYIAIRVLKFVFDR